MEKKLEGKTAIITGADSGIGQAMATEFARNGANVIINYLLDEDGAQYALQQVMQAGQQGLVVQTDLSDEAQVEAMFSVAIETFGDIFILVSIEATADAATKITEISTEQWRQAFAVNVEGYFFCARRFVQHRLQQGGKGRIIHVTSSYPPLSHSSHILQASTRGASMSLTKTMAVEVAEAGISVNNLETGMVKMPFSLQTDDDLALLQEQAQHIPMKRAARPAEVAKLALYLASADAEYCSGATFTIDGALSQATGQQV